MIAVNLFRARSTNEATELTRKVLLDYGATWAVTDSEFSDNSTEFVKEAKSAGPIRLALNCLGGEPAILLIKSLADRGTLVSYGAMTRSPMPVPVGPLIYRDIRLRGFWISAWIEQQPPSTVREMYTQLSAWFSEGSLRPSPYAEFPLEDWKKAIDMAKFDDSEPTGIRKRSF